MARGRPKKKTLEENKVEIQELSLEKVKKYLNLSEAELDKAKPETLKHIMSMAKLGMQFEKEMNLSQRTKTMNNVRIGKLISENKKELKAYFKRTIPEYM